MTKDSEELNVGDKIGITQTTLKSERNYSSQILDIVEDEIFIISGPISKNNLVMVHEGEKIKISYIIEDRGIYFFEAKVLKREYKDIYKLKINKTSKIEKHQQREFFRFKASIPVIKEFQINEEMLVERSRTQDISGNGLKLYSNYYHDSGDIVSCKFKIDECEIVTDAKIVRVEEIDSFDYNYSLGLAFIDISEADRDKIIQYIFLQQRLLREKELI